MKDCRAVLTQKDQPIRVRDNTVVGVERAWKEDAANDDDRSSELQHVAENFRGLTSNTPKRT